MQAFFLPCDLGQRFCIYHAARNGQARGAIVYLHPFAEEMNKARRMAALQSRALAKAGFKWFEFEGAFKISRFLQQDFVGLLEIENAHSSVISSITRRLTVH